MEVVYVLLMTDLLYAAVQLNPSYGRCAARFISEDGEQGWKLNSIRIPRVSPFVYLRGAETALS
jgi:hypothetical protein